MSVIEDICNELDNMSDEEFEAHEIILNSLLPFLRLKINGILETQKVVLNIAQRALIEAIESGKPIMLIKRRH